MLMKNEKKNYIGIYEVIPTDLEEKLYYNIESKGASLERCVE